MGTDAADRLAARILNASEDDIRFAPPEAKGRWLAILTEEDETWTDWKEDEERAGLRVLAWTQTKREFHEICQRITLDGSKHADWREGEEKLEAFFDRFQAWKYDEFKSHLRSEKPSFSRVLPERQEPHSPVRKTMSA